MYALALAMTPDRCFELARGTYAEMLRAGITCVGEFDYLHFSDALIAAANEVGIRLTLLDACYLAGGFGEPPNEAQRASATATRPRGPSAWERSRARRSAPRSTPSAPCRRTSWPPSSSSRAASRCTSTSPSSAPRTRPASPRPAARPCSCWPSTARSGRTPPPSTPPTCTRTTTWARPRSACARRPSATSPTASATRARGSRSAATATRSSTCSRRRARWSSTCG